MSETPQFTKPWLLAVWPGMSHVAINGGYYLMSKLDMRLFAELQADELFDVDHVEVKGGMIRPAAPPRSRLFVWNDPHKRNDIVLFVGEAQPPVGKYAFCRRLIEYAQQLGVQRVFTFAAMATQMHPEHASRVFGAATDDATLDEFKRLELKLLEDGHIGGLNGILIGVAAREGMRGACLLGEIPHIFAQLPFPKASLAVLEAFTTLAGVEIDFTELSDHAKAMERQLGEFLSQVEQAMSQRSEAESETEEAPSEEQAPVESRLTADDYQRIEDLFELAKLDRSKAYELKGELDRLEVFHKYENRFLDLFKPQQ